jgi:rubrerythrin
MSFKEDTKIKDFAQVGVVTAQKYRCEECGYITRDERAFHNHICVIEIGENGKDED